MVGWLAWRTAAAVALVVVAAAPGQSAELRTIESGLEPPTAWLRLAFSTSVRPTVTQVGDSAATRLVVDLPRGTQVGRQVRRVATASGPIARWRLGMRESGRLRLVVDLEPAATWRVARHGARVTLTVAPHSTPPAPAAPAAEPPVVTAARVTRPPLRTKIVLDPGHGGHDPGAQGYAVEKDVTLGIARGLAAKLRERLDAEVILTRSRDTTLSLAARTARANAEGADLFVSIHANASPNPRLQGVETYYLNNTNDRGTIRLAAMENGVPATRKRIRGRSDLRYILSDLVQVGKMEESIALASALQRALVGYLDDRYPGIADLGVKRGPFYVLVGAYMPCVLVETSFLTHPAEGRRLAGQAYREAVAEGLYHGIARFLDDARRAKTL